MSFIPHPIHLKPPVKNMDWTNQNLWQIVTETRTGQTTFLSSGMLLLGLVIGSVFKAHAMHKEIINCCSLMLTNLPVLGRALHVSDVWTKSEKSACHPHCSWLLSVWYEQLLHLTLFLIRRGQMLTYYFLEISLKANPSLLLNVAQRNRKGKSRNALFCPWKARSHALSWLQAGARP